MKIIKNVNNIIIFFFIVLSSFLISYTYYFDHLALGNALILNNHEIYKDKINLFFLISHHSPSFLLSIISFFIKINLSANFINILLTFFATLLNLSGIYLISKFITSSTFLSILIALTSIVLQKNFGDLDYPTLMFNVHTLGVFAFSLSTFILGLLTLRNLIFAFLFCLLLLSIHLVIGLWMFGLIILSSYFCFESKNLKKIGIIIFVLLIVFFFYINTFINYPDIPFELNNKDYDDYFFYIEAHRNNYGNLSNIDFNYVLKSAILLTLILLYFIFNFSNTSNNKNLFLKTLSVSIICSGIIYFLYKIFPFIFPEITIKTIPQRFFLIHSIIGYPVIISILYKFLERFLIYKNLNKNYSLQLFVIIILLHLISKHHALKSRFDNIKLIKDNKIKEQLFWKHLNDKKIDGYILTSNNLCNKTIIYSNSPLLFCFESLDYIPYVPKLASPTKRITKKILGLSYDKLKFKNTGGISEKEIKQAYESKNFEEWDILKKEFNLNTIIVPSKWNLNLDKLIIDGKYKVYKIE